MKLDKSLNRLLHKIKVFIFDLEGTLLDMPADWEGMRKDIHNYFLKNYDINMIFKPVLKKIDVAINNLSKIKSKSELEGIRKIVFTIIENTHIKAAKKSTLYEGVIELLTLLKEKGYSTTVLTRSGKEATKILLEKNLIIKFFDMVITRDDIIQSKPSSEGILKIINNYKFNPEFFLMIGDHPYDIIAGKNSCINTIGVLTGISTKKDLMQVKADYILEKTSELIKYFV